MIGFTIRNAISDSSRVLDGSAGFTIRNAIADSSRELDGSADAFRWSGET